MKRMVVFWRSSERYGDVRIPTGQKLLVIIDIEADLVNTFVVLDWYAKHYGFNREDLSGELLEWVEMPRDIKPY